jgi:hypothetical protein
MHLKTQLERIEGIHAGEGYFNQGLDSTDKSGLTIGKLDKALRVLSQLQQRKPTTRQDMGTSA